MAAPDLRSAYLTRGIIAYIGNKRALFPFLSQTFLRCSQELGGPGPVRFLDPFAGSGGVSRLGRALGFAVRSNDWERYAAVIARCRLVLSPSRLEAAFAAEGGPELAFSALDSFARGDGAEAALRSMPSPSARERWAAAFSAAAGAEPYLARHYAPRSTEGADWRSERLFYTAENARFLDRAREAVEVLYPCDPLGEVADPSAGVDAKAALLDALIYEAATRVNTSGVFKACHRGFGGHGGDSLPRITSAMRLRPPDLVDGPEALVACSDAATFCATLGSREAGGGVDIAYLDPPYNQHQYGSNYHLLTTLTSWDRPPVPEDRDGTGFLLDRSGIRGDWTRTRSDFCRRLEAPRAFSAVLDAIDARFVLVSYNDGGVVNLEELRELLEARGEVRVESVPYIAYRGGKQSATRTEGTRELLFVVDTSVPRVARSVLGREELRKIRARGALEALSHSRFDPRGPVPTAAAGVARIGPEGLLVLDRDALARLGAASLEAATTALRPLACRTSEAAFDLVLSLLRERRASGVAGKREIERLARAALVHLGKIAFRTYAAAYASKSTALRSVFEDLDSRRLLVALDRLDARATLRGVIAAP